MVDSPLPTISMVMIVKNEEEVLDRCLSRFAGHVDEIIVVDTGSTDRTKEIARRYTDRVLDFTWINDFSAARQFAMDQATCDWVAHVDADDVMQGAEFLRQEIANAAPDVNAIHWRYVVGFDAWGNVTLEYWRERCVRNDGGHRWRGKIHETLDAVGRHVRMDSQHVYLEHRPTQSALERKRGRNLAILEREIEEAGDNVPPRQYFYLGNEHADNGNIDAAIDAYTHYLRVGVWADELYLAHLRLANLYRVREDFDAALDVALAALKLQPAWPHAYFDLARTYYFRKDWKKVIHWTEIGRTMPPPVTSHFMNPLDWRYHWMICWTNALYHVGLLTEAHYWTKQALEICPGDTQHQHNLTFFSKTMHERLAASVYEQAST